MPKIAKKKATRANNAAISWEDAIDLYETHLRAARKSEKTIRRYRIVLDHFVWYLDENGEPAPGQVTLEHLRVFQCGLFTGETGRSKKPQAAVTVSTTTTVLATFFAFLTAEEKIDRNPTLRLERPKLPQHVPGEVLTVREVERLLAGPDSLTPRGLRDRALVELYYATGLRLTEALGLDLADLNHDEREIRVRGKGEKDRVVPVTRSAWVHLAAYLERARRALATKHPDSHHAVFLSTLGRRMSYQSVEELFRELRAKVGIKKHMTPHTLRRTFATHLLKNGVNLREIQALLGHSDLNTTAKYLRLDASELRRQILLHHPREHFEP